MTRSTDTQLTPFIENFGDTMTPLFKAASEVARESTEMYVRGFNTLVEQQRLTWEASQRWFSGIVGTQAPLSAQLVESFDAAQGELIQAAEEATTRGGEAGAEAAKRGSHAVTRASRKASQAATKPRRRPAQAQSKAASSDAERTGPAKWTGDAYDALTAADVVEQLPKLSQRELRELERYETAHQARQTVLQKVSSLRGQEPVAGYDDLNVQAIRQQLTQGDDDLAARIRDYERPRKSRDSVLSAADAQLSKA